MQRNPANIFSSSRSLLARAADAEFIAASPRSLCVSLCADDDAIADALSAVRTTAFTATISPDSVSRSEKKSEPRRGSFAQRADERRTFAPFVPLGLAGLTLPQIERAAILETLIACGGRRRQAARKLGVSEKTIYNKIKHYRLQAELDAVANGGNC